MYAFMCGKHISVVDEENAYMTVRNRFLTPCSTPSFVETEKLHLLAFPSKQPTAQTGTAPTCAGNLAPVY